MLGVLLIMLNCPTVFQFLYKIQKKDFVANNNSQLFTNCSAESLSGIQISNKVLGILTKMSPSSFYYSTN